MFHHRALENEEKPFSPHFALEYQPPTYWVVNFTVCRQKNALTGSAHQGIFNVF